MKKIIKNIIIILMVLYIIFSIQETFLQDSSVSDGISDTGGSYEVFLWLKYLLLILQVIELAVFSFLIIKKHYKIAMIMFVICSILVYIVPIGRTVTSNSYYRNIYSKVISEK